MPDKNKLILPVLLSSATLTVMAGAILTPVLNLMRDGLGIDASYVGSIITTHGVSVAFFSLFMGSVIDKKGVRAPYITGLFLYAVAGGSGLIINSYWILIISRVFIGIALAGIFTCINVIILNYYQGFRRDKVMGWRGSAQSFGGIMWPLIGGALGNISWHLPFSIYLLSIPIGIAACIAVKNQFALESNRPQSMDKHSVFYVMKKNPTIFIIFGLMFFSNFQLYAVVIYLPQFLETFGVSNPLKISLFITTMATAAGLMSFVYGRIRNLLSYRTISMTGVLIWAVVFFSISRAHVLFTIILSVFLFGAGQGLIMPTVMAWIGDVVPISYRGRFSSYLGTLGYLGQFLSPILLAQALIHIGLRGVFTVSASIGIAWFIILTLLAEEKKIPLN